VTFEFWGSFGGLYEFINFRELNFLRWILRGNSRKFRYSSMNFKDRNHRSQINEFFTPSFHLNFSFRKICKKPQIICKLTHNSQLNKLFLYRRKIINQNISHINYIEKWLIVFKLISFTIFFTLVKNESRE
jgi:hypothetical protein